MEARFARATDIVKRTKFILPDHYIGYVIEQNDQFMGMGWAMWDKDERPFVFFEIADEAREYKYRIGRWSRRFLAVLKNTCDVVYTLEDKREPGSQKWIEWLGFKPTEEVIEGMRVMKCLVSKSQP